MENKSSVDADRISALFNKCGEYLKSIENVERTLKGAPLDARLIMAQDTFSGVSAIIMDAEKLNVINFTTFMHDKKGVSHWAGSDAAITSKVGSIVIEGDQEEVFNYKKHCRVPLRSVKNAAAKLCTPTQPAL